MSVSISAVVLARDEEVNIGRCLESLTWADEMIVVDSGSTDGTVEIARQHRARVLVNEMLPFNASAQRNWALHNADLIGDWVLFLDADEEVTPALAEAIRHELSEAADEIVGYRLCPRFMFLGQWLRYTMGYPAWHDRLVRRDTIGFAGSWPSDHFEPTDKQIGYIHEPYLHFSFNNGIARWLAKHNVYSTNVARSVMEELRYNQKGQARVLPLKRRLEYWASGHIVLGVLFRLGYQLLVRRSFLDGYPGIMYSLMMAAYQLMIGLKVEEFKRRNAGLPM